MDAPPPAYLCHRCPGRARLKFAAHRGNAMYFQELSALIAELPGVTGVQTNALTASVLILHQGELADVLGHAASRRLFRLSEEPVYARSQFAEPDEISVKGLVVLVVLGLGVLQVFRGYALGPASGLLALAWHLARDHPSDVTPPAADSTD